MLGGIHFLVGSSLAVSMTENEFLALAVGFLSHHLLDRLPHLDLNVLKRKITVKDWTKEIWFIVIFEFVFFLLLSFYLLQRFFYISWEIALIGGIGGILPDIITMLFKDSLLKTKLFNGYLAKLSSYYFSFHKSFHYKFKDQYLLPILIELLLIFVSVVNYLLLV